MFIRTKPRPGDSFSSRYGAGKSTTKTSSSKRSFREGSTAGSKKRDSIVYSSAHTSPKKETSPPTSPQVTQSSMTSHLLMRIEILHQLSSPSSSVPTKESSPPMRTYSAAHPTFSLLYVGSSLNLIRRGLPFQTSHPKSYRRSSSISTKPTTRRSSCITSGGIPGNLRAPNCTVTRSLPSIITLSEGFFFVILSFSKSHLIILNTPVSQQDI